MRLSWTFIIFGLASVVCAAPRPMNAEARDIGHTEASKLHKTGALATRAGGGSSADPNPSPSDQAPAEKKKEEDDPQEDTAADRGDGLGSVLSCTGAGRPLNDRQKTLARTALIVFFQSPSAKEKLPPITVPNNCARYYVANNVGAGGRANNIVNFQFQHRKCGEGFCRGFLNISTGAGKVRNAKEEVMYSVAASPTMVWNAKLNSPRLASPVTVLASTFC
ncbi:MAG: hypothetical protein NXY57DRAFT_979742 [Lentinula lateritia]|nr:MAG: hypothetical protein NXY57DRAFT_979742 [Lentinula lateritia]